MFELYLHGYKISVKIFYHFYFKIFFVKTKKKENKKN